MKNKSISIEAKYFMVCFCLVQLFALNMILRFSEKSSDANLSDCSVSITVLKIEENNVVTAYLKPIISVASEEVVTAFI